MKKLALLPIALLWMAMVQIPACKKEKDPVNIIFSEEFQDVSGLPVKGWILRSYFNQSNGPTWGQGQNGVDKGGSAFGFPAHSYRVSKTEYTYVGLTGYPGADSLSSWLISPQLSLKDGDVLSFYTRGESSSATDRLQVRLNMQDATPEVGNTSTSVGKYEVLLLAVNPNAAAGGYPAAWTKQQITIGGLGGERLTRFALRYNPNTAASRGIGVDLLEITRP